MLRQLARRILLRERRPARITVALLGAALLVVPPAATARAAGADTPSPSPSESAPPSPPAVMSAVGGERLAQPGDQVEAGPDTPELPEDLTAYSWMVSDATTGEVLAARNPHWQLPPASTLKMLFAEVLLPRFEPTGTHTVSAEELAGVGEGSSLVGVKEELTYTVEDLWLGVFLRSGNDAVHVLSAMAGGVPEVVRQMQERAIELNALDTHVVTPDGYDEDGQVSSAYDLTLIARAGLQNPDFRRYASTRTAEFPGEGDETFEIQNTNDLLGVYEGMIGVKNGYTSNAGNTFVGAAERDGRTLLVAVMHPERGDGLVYDEAEALLDWGFAAAGTVTPIGRLVEPGPQVGEAGVQVPSTAPPASLAPWLLPASPTPAAAGGAQAEAADAGPEHVSAPSAGVSGLGPGSGASGGRTALSVALLVFVLGAWVVVAVLRRQR
ncbi:D-alanyl-D-alanine carboxypeptidase family protein [Allostreptomyces psammosilenae]|uniref:D-alanyl-D-alanine carboxypeptidase (Penicillin-binding protein 5/6) n=1 Tax=Allostreptomyces psammosilenae TaxID=1892865 RepID=A0A853A023_9ACTN|nr:D-alanyl-D-alanine carboxypeptidase [Allostreptomyces psammosilenae]NYI07973.1 D-alanyl-D-alanine carboxypeptidase (penicillin-binding protein 5/6) [Allostreptomyces psammosilenae]